MSASIEIPARFVQRAQEHLRRTGRPLVYGQRGKGRELAALQNPASGRWALYALPEPMVVGRFSFAELQMRLASCAKDAVGGLPRRFECEGHEVGRVDDCDGLAVVSSTLALSCLSYVLRQHHPKTGFFVRVPD
jgi:hypothetical protein